MPRREEGSKYRCLTSTFIRGREARYIKMKKGVKGGETIKAIAKMALIY